MRAVTEGPPAALDEPAARVRAGWTAALSLANLAVFMAFFTPIQILLPLQLEHLDEAHKAADLAWVTGAGALVAVVVNPLAGALSDRTAGRFGRRRPWIVGGALAGAAGLVITSAQHTLPGIVVGWCLAQSGLNAMLAGVTAPVADQVPVGQRASVSGWTGIMQSLGLVLGALLVTMAVSGVGPGYLLTALLTIALALPYALCFREPVLPSALRPAFRRRAPLTGLWTALWAGPRSHPDFGWAWLTRFLINLGNALGTLYLLFYLTDEVHRPDPDTGVLVLTVIYTVSATLTAIPAGIASDRVGKRKVFVVACSVIMAVAALLLAAAHTWTAVMIAAAVLGAGFGIYLAVDQALITQVLPSAADRARDLGVINIANSGPQVLAPALAAPIVAHLGGYPGLYVATALVTLLGGVLVLRIVGVD
ncbi:MFS transporter [Streptomyces sp. H10-C2]|uniref:MFS transporter n=1 Tax=unclassified Streptomyces TaxID=2593676 RepID=UPI0024BB72ED|nr:MULTISPECIES: MFS transporter [unclassified Streptomyces]MDJ0341838.1 MFS transporter [Streptomyces sp. PH10-H1]MDJ0370408.1 MFS transporter [Streptomyces sp. H10-C2]